MNLTEEEAHLRWRNLTTMADPRRWVAWPFLPLVRRGEHGCELGLLFDALNLAGLTGYRATVFRANLFELPAHLEDFLALPRETFDTPEEVHAAGWRVD